MKDKIIEILESETFHISDESGTYKVVENCDFDRISERIIKLFENNLK